MTFDARIRQDRQNQIRAAVGTDTRHDVDDVVFRKLLARIAREVCRDATYAGLIRRQVPVDTAIADAHDIHLNYP